MATSKTVTTTILQLAAAVYDEAVAMVGEGEEANALAMATLAGLLVESNLVEAAAPVSLPVSRTRRHAPRGLRASA